MTRPDLFRHLGLDPGLVRAPGSRAPHGARCDGDGAEPSYHPQALKNLAALEAARPYQSELDLRLEVPDGAEASWRPGGGAA